MLPRVASVECHPAILPEMKPINICSYAHARKGKETEMPTCFMFL